MVIDLPSAIAEDPVAEGSVSNNCDFFNLVTGELAVNNVGTVLNSSDPNGTSGRVSLDCTGDANLKISKPKQNIVAGETPFSDEELTATATSSDFGGISISSGDSGATIPGDSIGEIKVDMQADKGSEKILPGTYSFTVTLTATP
jgi:hypothetical protein